MKQLIIHMDVSSYSDEQIKALYDAVLRHLCDAETAHSDGHPGVENLVFQLKDGAKGGDALPALLKRVKRTRKGR